jgi:hypothetical protein
MVRITSNEKAVIGGVVAALFAIIVQLQQSKQLTWHDLGVAVVGYVLTHLAVWATTNSPKPPVDAPPTSTV